MRRMNYERKGLGILTIVKVNFLFPGKSADLDGSQIEDEDDIVQEEIESDSEFDEASPDVPVPEPERTNASVDMTF